MIVAAQALALAVDVGEAQRSRRDPVHVAVEEVELLARELGDAVDVDRHCRVLLVDGVVAGSAVDLTSRGVHDARASVGAAQRLEQGELAAGVDVEVAQRVFHGVDVADLSGEVEHVVGAVDDVDDLAAITDVGDDHLDRRRQPVEVASVAAVLGHEGVDHDDVGTQLDQGMHQVRPDEPEAAGDDAARAPQGAQIDGGVGSSVHGRHPTGATPRCTLLSAGSEQVAPGEDGSGEQRHRQPAQRHERRRHEPAPPPCGTIHEMIPPAARIGNSSTR